MLSARRAALTRAILCAPPIREGRIIECSDGFAISFQRRASWATRRKLFSTRLGVWPSTATMSPEVALRVPAVSAAVRAISEAVACLPLYVYRVLPDGSREEVREHPVNALLQGRVERLDRGL